MKIRAPTEGVAQLLGRGSQSLIGECGQRRRIRFTVADVDMMSPTRFAADLFHPSAIAAYRSRLTFLRSALKRGSARSVSNMVS